MVNVKQSVKITLNGILKIGIDLVMKFLVQNLTLAVKNGIYII